MPMIADRHQIGLAGFSLEACHASDSIAEILKGVVDKVPLEQIADIVESAFVRAVAPKIAIYGEYGLSRGHEATMLLDGEIASDIIPLIVAKVELRLTTRTLTEGLLRITESEQRDFLLSALFPDMPDAARQRLASDPEAIRITEIAAS